MSELTMIRTNCESEFDRVYRDAQFFATLMEQNREMENFVNESLIKASGNKRAINEMYIIHESAFTDKIKAFFEKIKGFFKKIFNKLGASMTALFGEQKKFIDQYAGIITKCKYQAGDADGVKDHFKGVPRIFDAVDNCDKAIIGTNMDKYFAGDNTLTADGQDIKVSELYPYDDADALQKAEIPDQVNMDNIKAKQFEAFIKEGGYWEGKKAEGFDTKTNENNVVDIDRTYRVYFDGSEDTVAWTTDQIENNMQAIINLTYAGPQYMTKLEKLVNQIEKKMDEASKKMEDYYKAQSEKIKQGIANSKGKANSDVGDTGLNKKVKENDISVSDDSTKSAGDPEKYSATVNGQKFTGSSEADVKNQIKARGFAESYVFTEDININTNNSSSSSNSSGNSPQGKVSSQTGENEKKTVVNKTNDVNSMKTTNNQAKDSTTKGVTDDNVDAVTKKANDLLDRDIYNRQAIVNTDVQISSSIARAAFSAFQLANKDYWAIIKAHVQWYLGNPGAEKNSENQTSRPKNLNMNINNNASQSK